MQPKIHNATFCNPSATRIKKCVIIQIRPTILIREVSEWSVFLLVNIELSHSRGIIDHKYQNLTR